MSDYLVTDTELTETADAIRAKTGDSSLIEWESGTGFADAVAAISGGGSKPIDIDADVVFIDYDGEILYSYSHEEIVAMSSLPDVPDHSNDEIPLIFEEWNWTLQQIKDWGYPCTVGPFFDTADHATHFVIEIQSLTDATFTINTNFPANSTVDWGDGSQFTTVASGGTQDVSHTYNATGKYHVIATPGGTGKFNRGSLSQASGDKIKHFATGRRWTYLLQMYVRFLKTAAISTNIYGFNAALKTPYSLRSITIKNPGAANSLDDVPNMRLASIHSNGGEVLTLWSKLCGGNITMARQFWGPCDLGSGTNGTDCRSCKRIVIPAETANISQTNAFNNLASTLRIDFAGSTPPTKAYSYTLAGMPNMCVICFPYESTAYLTATNYPSPSTYAYLGVYKSTADEALPTIVDGKALTWYVSTENARLQLYPITIGNGKEVYCRYA